MKAKYSLLVIVSIFFSIAAVSAQITATVTEGRWEHSFEPFGPGAVGPFHFGGSGNDINGDIQASFTDGLFIGCSSYGAACFPGQTIRLLDRLDGRNPIRQNGALTVVQGVNYRVVFYRGLVKFDGGTIRIPFFYAKRESFKITVRSKVTIGFNGYPDPSFTNPLFMVSGNTDGLTTVTFKRRGEHAANGYDVYKVTHVFPVPSS